MPALSPSELYVAIQQGSREAEEQLYADLQDSSLGVWFLLKQKAGQDAEDLLADVWIALVQHIKRDSIEHPDKVFAYARGIAEQMCLKRSRELSASSSSYYSMKGSMAA